MRWRAVQDDLLITTGRLARAWGALRFLRLKHYGLLPPPDSRLRPRVRDAAQRLLPTFLLAGAFRSGVGMVLEQLYQHPEVAVPLCAEIPLLRSWTAVRANGPLVRGARALVTGNRLPYTTGYSARSLRALGALAEDPAMRVIYVVREPVERLVAHWRWDRRIIDVRAQDPLWSLFPTVDEYLRCELDALRGGLGSVTLAVTGGGYLQQGVYAPLLRRLFELFGRERVLVVEAARFFADPEGELRTLTDHLGLAPFAPPPLAARAASRGGETPSAETLATVRAFYREHDARLFELLGRELGWAERR